MKKIFFVLLFICTGLSVFAKDWNLPFGWGKDKDLKNKKSNTELLSEIEFNYTVDKVKIPEEYCESFADKAVYFDNPERRDNYDLQTSFSLIQKKKLYTLQIVDISLTASYAWRGIFKLIDEKNECVQAIEIREIDKPFIVLYDCNFDGCLDLVVQTATIQNGNKYNIYYWNKTAKKFSGKPEEIIQPVFDTKKKYMIQTENIKLEDKTLATVYSYFKHSFGRKKFFARVRYQFFYTDENSQNNITLSVTKNKKADIDYSAGVYSYTLPKFDYFTQMESLKQDAVRKQYNDIVKIINGL